MKVLETISEDTLVFLQIHKRIWPASQRDVIFWSHMRHLSDDQDRDGPDIWTVVNHSTEHKDYPVRYQKTVNIARQLQLCCFQANAGKCVRIYLTVCMMCQTRINPPKNGTPVTRDDISCKITYCSVGKCLVTISSSFACNKTVPNLIFKTSTLLTYLR